MARRWQATQSQKVVEAEATAADTPKEATASDGTEPSKQQEKGRARKPDAEHRIGELTRELKQLRADLEEARRPKDVKAAESSPAKPAPPQYTRPKPTVDDKSADGKPKYNSYEDYVEELTGLKAEQRIVQQNREQAQRAQMAETKARVEAAKSKYENFDQISSPFIKSFLDAPDIPLPVKVMVSDSKCLGRFSLCRCQ